MLFWKSLSVPICEIRGKNFPSFRGSSENDSFPAQSGFLEIDQQGDFELGDIQVTEHLGHVRVVERRHDFRVDDHRVVHDEIRNERADEATAIAHRIFALLPYDVTTVLEFKSQGVFVQFFIQTRLQLVQNGHRSTNDVFGESSVLHDRILPRMSDEREKMFFEM